MLDALTAKGFQVEHHSHAQAILDTARCTAELYLMQFQHVMPR